MLTSSKRIFKQGLLNVRRQGSVSAAAVLILVITLTIIALLFVLRGLALYTIDTLQNKIDVSVYFKEDATQDDIFAAQDELKKLSEVKEVKYVSPDEALEQFRARYREDPVITESLDEVGGNPLLASLNVKVWEPPQYASVVNFLEASSFGDLIDSIDYSQNKAVIERLFQITSGVTRWGFVLSGILGLMAALLIFNTVRLAIFGTRQEIKVMHLVGADRRFLMGPFMVQGAIVGFIAVFITLLFLAIISLAIGSRISTFTAGFHPFKYFLANFWMIFGIQLFIGVGIGVASSWLAVRKYLR